MAPGASIRFDGRTLYLTEDPGLLARQLRGETLAYDPARKLIDNISTDELTPGWVCYYYDETLARYCLVGLRGNVGLFVEAKLFRLLNQQLAADQLFPHRVLQFGTIGGALRLLLGHEGIGHGLGNGHPVHGGEGSARSLVGGE